MAQLVCPLAVQVVGTPVHLLGLDYYNHQGSSLQEHLANVRKLYWNSLLIRMVRFLPAYGFGGIINIESKKFFRKVRRDL